MHHLYYSRWISLIFYLLFPLRFVRHLQSETLSRMCLIQWLKGRFIPVLVMEKVAPPRSPVTVYGRANNALADDEAPARVPPCLFHPFLSVCSPPFLSLAFLFYSSFPSSFLASSPLLPPSVLSAFLSLCVSFLRRAQSRSVTVEHFTAVLYCSPQSEPIHENKRVFIGVPPPYLPLHTRARQTTRQQHTRWRTKLWSGFVYDRGRQYRDCFRVVSSREMYRCQECVLYCMSGPLAEAILGTENIISYDLLWYKSELSAVNLIHNYSL